jgi:Nodulation protein Z (NodZ)
VRNEATTCQSRCNLDKAATDSAFYTDLRDRFRGRRAVDDFREKHFNDADLVVGIHIRAGNGETGDFAERKRGIADTDTWLQNLVQQLETTVFSKQQGDKRRRVVLFVATDTPSMIHQLRKRLLASASITITVVHYKQSRPEHGAGVLFGEQGKVTRNGDECLAAWENAVTDIMVLSHVDILIAARPSSFTQSLPMSILYKHQKKFCEVSPGATAMLCYENFHDWCCLGRTEFSLQGIQQRYDYLRMPETSLDQLHLTDSEIKKKFKLQKRPAEGCEPRPEGWKQVCLPYDWSKFVVKPRLPKQAPPARLERKVRQNIGRPEKRGGK